MGEKDQRTRIILLIVILPPLRMVSRVPYLLGRPKQGRARRSSQIATYLPTRKKTKKKETKNRQRKEGPNISKTSASEKHLKKKIKKGVVLQGSNLLVNFSFDSSSEHEIVSVKKTKKSKRKEILKDNNLPASKKKI